MNAFPYISVIVPAYNEELNIGKCIKSLKNQTYLSDKYEIIVVDNNSTDGTLEIIKNSAVRCVQEKKKGRAAAKNAGIRIAKGEILAFIDGDCVANENWLENLVKGFSDNDIGGVGGEIKTLYNEEVSVLEKYLEEKGHLAQSKHKEHIFLPFAVTANAAYRAEVFKNAGFFDENIFGEDADMSWRMQLNTKYKLSYADDAIVYHPYESNLKNLFKQKIRHGKAFVMLYKKYKNYRKDEKKNLRHVYWEYNSLFRRLTKILIKRARGRDVEEKVYYQTMLELAWKIGLLKGSIENRIWCL